MLNIFNSIQNSLDMIKAKLSKGDGHVVHTVQKKCVSLHQSAVETGNCTQSKKLENER